MERKHVPTFRVPQHLQQYAVQPGEMALSSDHIKHTKSNCKGLVLSVCSRGAGKDLSSAGDSASRAGTRAKRDNLHVSPCVDMFSVLKNCKATSDFHLLE